MGGMNEGTVYDAEMRALYEALKWVERHGTRRMKTIRIFVDSQGSLHAVNKVATTNVLANPIITKIRQIINKKIDLKLYWVKAHIGIEGNENADMLAKAGLDKVGIKVPIVKNSLKGKIKHINEQEKLIEWMSSGDARTSHDFFPDWRRFASMRDSNGNRAFWRLLAGKPTLRYFLVKCWKKGNDSICSCGEGVEDVHHFVLQCSKYEELRGEWEDKNINLEWFTRSVENLNILFDFVNKTERFS